jgi:hypothetical protein
LSGASATDIVDRYSSAMRLGPLNSKISSADSVIAALPPGLSPTIVAIEPQERDAQLMPLDLTPSQWEPLIERLSARYCTICLGGPLLGVVAILEARGRSDYLSVDPLAVRPWATLPQG